MMDTLQQLWEAWSHAIKSLSIGAFLQALSLPISMTVAWLTFKATTANLRYSLIVGDVTDQIKGLSEYCRKIAGEAEIHFLGSYEGGFTASAAQDSRKRIVAQIKALDDRRAVLNVFLSRKKVEELRVKFDEWQVALQGESFPVTRKEDRCKEYDQPIAQLRKATSCFECYLAELRKCCLNDAHRFRKTIS